MTASEVVKHFGSIKDAARALGVTYQAVQQWTKAGEVPEGRQYQIQLLTKGRLKADSKAAV